MKRILIILAGLLALGAPSQADSLTFTLNPAIEFGPAGGVPNPSCANASISCLIFFGTITPSTDTDFYINDISIDFTPSNAFLSNNDVFFFNNVPGSFLIGDPSYTGPVFEIDVDPSTPVGLYSGTATLLGGPDPFTSMDPVAFQTFQVDVVSPEPGMSLLVLLGLSTMALAARRRWIAQPIPQRIKE